MEVGAQLEAACVYLLPCVHMHACSFEQGHWQQRATGMQFVAYELLSLAYELPACRSQHSAIEKERRRDQRPERRRRRDERPQSIHHTGRWWQDMQSRRLNRDDKCCNLLCFACLARCRGLDSSEAAGRLEVSAALKQVERSTAKLLLSTEAAKLLFSSEGAAKLELSAPLIGAEVGGWRLEPTPPPRRSLQSFHLTPPTFHLTPPTHIFRQSSCMCERVRWKVGGWGCRCKVTEAEALVARSPSLTCVLPTWKHEPQTRSSKVTELDVPASNLFLDVRASKLFLASKAAKGSKVSRQRRSTANLSHLCLLATTITDSRRAKRVADRVVCGRSSLWVAGACGCLRGMRRVCDRPSDQYAIRRVCDMS